jgi:hypothetical protein
MRYLPSLKAIAAALAVFEGACGLPQASGSAAQSTAAVACPAKAFRQFQPFMRTIGNPTTSPSVFHISQDSNRTRIAQVMTFSGVPASATNMTLEWSVSPPPRVFTANGSATSEVHALDASILNLSSFSEKNVEAAASNVTFGQAAFDFWPDSPTQTSHLVSSKPIKVTSDISFRSRLLLGKAGDVRIEQNANNGWLLKYDC